jgi:hypothetical protein
MGYRIKYATKDLENIQNLNKDFNTIKEKVKVEIKYKTLYKLILSLIILLCLRKRIFDYGLSLNIILPVQDTHKFFDEAESFSPAKAIANILRDKVLTRRKG